MKDITPQEIEEIIRIIEPYFGEMFSKFSILNKGMDLEDDEASKIIEAICTKNNQQLTEYPFAQSIGSNIFYLSFDLRRHEIEFIHNIDVALQYKVPTFDFLYGQGSPERNLFYFSLIERRCLKNYMRWATECYDVVLDKKLKEILKPMVHRYVIHLPMLCGDGKYRWVMQEAVGLQYDNNKNLVRHLNKYTVIQEEYSQILHKYLPISKMGKSGDHDELQRAFVKHSWNNFLNFVGVDSQLANTAMGLMRKLKERDFSELLLREKYNDTTVDSLSPENFKQIKSRFVAKFKEYYMVETDFITIARWLDMNGNL